MPKIGGSTTLLKPYWSTTDGETVRLYHGDVIDVLRRLPAQSVQCVVTSPPYWGLRDYGVDGQIGSEATPDLFVVKMVEVFREVWRVLRDDGTLWLNLGDSYSNAGTRQGDRDGGVSNGINEHRKVGSGYRPNAPGITSGNLVGVPWRVALALQADGWVLRQDIVWHKPSPMPESVRNRCTKSHEYVFLLVKRMRYFYDAEAIKTDAEPAERTVVEGGRKFNQNSVRTFGDKPSGNSIPGSVVRTGTKANKRSVWTVSSQGYAGAHFATFPPKLIEPMILAGTSERGACADCGAPWRRVVEEKKLTRDRPNDYVKRTGEEGTGNSCANSVAGVAVKMVGWEPTCDCNTTETRPCVVLDPFIGSGTTCCVAVENGRNGWGIDLSEKYLRNNAIPRIEGVLQSIPSKARLVPREHVIIEGGDELL